MEITEVRIYPVGEAKLKAFATIVIDGVFIVSDIKIIEGRNGRFLSMPSVRRKDGTFRDVAHPLNHETRRRIEQEVLRRHDEVLAAGDPVAAGGGQHGHDGADGGEAARMAAGWGVAKR